MHKEVFSARERAILEKFLNSNEKLEALDRVLKMRIKQRYMRLVEDFDLLRKVVEKIVES